MEVSIIISTYGDESWRELALSRAYPSALDQGAHEIIVGHDDSASLSYVRNALADKASGDWLLFLDGDDELAPGYLEAMRVKSDGLLLTPARAYVVGRRRQQEHFEDEIPLIDGNWLCIGTLVPRRRFLEIGGFREWPLFEDWDLWARCELPIVKVPKALYLAHYSRTSRNRLARREERNYWHQMIGHDLWPEYYDAPSGQEHQTRQVLGVRKLAVA